MKQLYEAALRSYPFGLWSVYIVSFTCYQFATCRKLPNIYPIYATKIPWLLTAQALIELISTRVGLYLIFTAAVSMLTRDHTDYLGLFKFICLVTWSICQPQLEFTLDFSGFVIFD